MNTPTVDPPWNPPPVIEVRARYAPPADALREVVVRVPALTLFAADYTPVISAVLGELGQLGNLAAYNTTPFTHDGDPVRVNGMTA